MDLVDWRWGDRIIYAYSYLEKVKMSALSFYSRPYVNALLWSPVWKTKQNNWINGSQFYFDLPSSINELQGWNNWTQSKDFSDIVLYVVMASIMERQQRFTDNEHAYFKVQYEYAQNVLNKTEIKELLEDLLKQVSFMNAPQTYDALNYAYEKYLISQGISLTQSKVESGTREPALSSQELKRIQAEIERKRLEREYSKTKGQGRSLSKQSKIIYGSSITILLIATSIIISQRGK
jgi:hypothetical protein